jgi:hypothetical protein
MPLKIRISRGTQSIPCVFPPFSPSKLKTVGDESKGNFSLGTPNIYNFFSRNPVKLCVMEKGTSGRSNSFYQELRAGDVLEQGCMMSTE